VLTKQILNTYNAIQPSSQPQKVHFSIHIIQDNSRKLGDFRSRGVSFDLDRFREQVGGWGVLVAAQLPAGFPSLRRSGLCGWSLCGSSPTTFISRLHPSHQPS